MSRVPELSWLSVCEVGLGIIGLRLQGLCRVSKLHLLVYLPAALGCAFIETSGG